MSPKGLRPNPEKVRAIQSLGAPTTVKGVRSYLGLTGYYRNFIPKFSSISRLLTKLTKIIAASIKDSDPYSEWNLKKVDIMREVLNAKINSSEEFRKELSESADKLLVEASATDTFWGSGLNYNLTLTTQPDQFPGKNMLGKLLVELRNEF